MSLYAAYLVREGEGFIFLSPDDKEYLEVNLPRLPDLDEGGAERMAGEVQNMLDGKEPDGTPRRLLPLRFARRYFTQVAHAEDNTSDVTLFVWDDGEWVVEKDLKFQGVRTATI